MCMEDPSMNAAIQGLIIRGINPRGTLLYLAQYQPELFESSAGYLRARGWFVDVVQYPTHLLVICQSPEQW